MNNKKDKFLIPLSNESIKKALLGASIIVGGFGLMGNTNAVYADADPIETEIVDNNQTQDKGIDTTNEVKDEDISERDRDKEKESENSLEETEDTKELVEYSEESIDPIDSEVDPKENEEDTVGIDDELSTDLGEDLMFSEENIGVPVRAVSANNEQNYAEDEKNVGTYKDTQLERGNGPAASYTPPDEVDRFIDGFRYKTLEPSADSPDQTLWGIEVEFNKDEGQRTYTDFYFSNSGNIKDFLDTGSIEANDKENPIYKTGDFKAPTYKAYANLVITSSGRELRNLNLYADEKDLEHINNVNNKNTVMAWEGHYKKDNPNGPKATEGGSAAFNFTVNPWPNENDKLNLIYLNGDYEEKQFVQGQIIETGIKVENLDDNAKERLVGQVYHPVTGEVVPGAEAYIDDNGKVYVKMPEGALKLDGGKYVVNEKSIFYKNPDYKGLTHLDVKFFARPRTEAEFRAVGVEANYGADNYTSTGAGTEIINHKGQSVTIDKQGIARYDHYNLIGGFNINLDDTRYYDQEFKDEDENKIDPNASTSVSPGKKATIRILDPSEPGGTQKTGSEMDAAYKAGEATGKLKEEYLIVANKKIARELGISYDELMKEENKDKRWVIDGRSDNISYFDITAPKNSKAGDTIALPVVYTYTNGSTDTRWFHFVVQESTLNKPEYEAQVNFPSEEQTSPVKITEDEKKLSPVSYSIKEGFDNKDDHGNEWTVSIDEKSGQVTAKPNNSGKFDGGEKLQVPVVAHYDDPLQEDEDITEETTAEFIIKERANMTPRYNAKAGKEGDKLSSDVILDEKDEFNRKPTKFTLNPNVNAYKDDKGNTWKVSIDENTGTVTATVPEGDNIDGALVNVPVTAHYSEGDTDKGTKEVEVQFIASGTKNTIVHKEEIPFETKVEVVDDLKKGEWRYKKVGDVELKGKPGSKETTYTIKDSKIVDTKEDTIDPENAVIEVGSQDFVDEFEHVEEIPFKYEVKEVDTLKKGEYEIVKAGKVGSKTTRWKIVNSKVEGEPTVTTVEAEDAIINVGKGTNSGTHEVVEKAEVPFDTIVEFDDSLAPGEQKVTQEGVPGEKTRTNTLTIEDGKVTNTDEGEFTQSKAPVNQIIKVGRNTEGEVVHEEKIPFKYNISYDENLKKGEYVIEVAGTEGTKKTTWTIKNSQIVGEPSIEKTDPVNAVIRVGSGILNGSHDIVEKVPVPFETIVEFDDSLKPGEQKVTQEGELGEKTRTNTLTIVDGEVTKTTPGKFEENKAPVNKIIKVGRNTEGKVEHKEEIPFEYDIQFDPDFYTNYPNEENNYKIITKGEAGEKTTTWTIKNSEIVGEPVEDITKKPVNAVIKVGQKDYTGNFTHEVKEEIPFTVKVIEDYDIPAGQTKVDQVGKAGTKKTTFTQAIKNGQADGDLTSEEHVIEEPVEHVIRVGKKPANNNESVTSEVDVEVTYVYDNNQELGYLKVDDLVKGKVTTTIENVYDPETGKIKTVEKTVIEPGKRQVTIGTKDHTGEFIEEIKKIIPYETEIKFVDDLKAGEKRTIQTGENGETTQTITRKIENGEVKSEEKSDVVTSKEVKNQIIEVGTMTDGTHRHKEEIPFEYEVVYDPEMKAGTYEIVRPGSKGEKLTIWTIKNSKVVPEETEVLETKPKNALIKVGRKDFTGSFETEKTSPVEFETEYIVDNSMKPGTAEVINEGTLGEDTVTVTHTITNGEITESKEGTAIRTKEPTKRIVKVGPAKTDGTHTYTSKKPFDVEVRVNPNLAKGEHKVIQEGVEGEEEYTITIENSKVTNTSDPKETKTPVNEIIEVGSEDFTGTFETKKTKFTEFETIYEIDNTMEPGTTKVVKEGQHGEDVITTTHTIVNGEVTDSKEGEPLQTKAAVNRIVKVGAAKSNGTHEYTNKIPYDVEVRVNPKLAKGEYNVVQKGEVGEEKYTLTIVDSKVTKTSEPSILKIPVKEIIEVGDQDFTGTVEYVDKDLIPFETEVKVDSSLKPGEIVEDQKGELGEQETKITRTIKNGEAGEENRGASNVTKDPVTRKIRVGSKTNGQYKETETIPFEVEVRKDPSLKKGEWKYNEINGVEQRGESGLKERTLTIENSQITETSDYTTVREPKKAVILVGDEDFTGVVTHTEHYEIPFEVEVRYNSELPAGTSKEIQKGVQGSYDIEFNQKIKNGAPDGDLLKVESNRVDPKKHIIEVGTKVETPENNYSKDVEVEIEYVYDDTKDKGVVETGELIPGKVETKVVDKYNPETGKIEQTTKQEVTKAKQKVIVGTKDFTGKYEYSKTCPIPFEVEIIEDDTLEKGKSEVKQKGVPGSKTTKYEQDIKNGQPDGEARKISEETTKEPVKHIVRVGTKPAEPTEGETTKTIERDIPFEIKVIYDENLEAGSQVIEKEGKAGKEEVTITQKVKDSKPVGDATETTKTITEKEDRVVRVGVKPVVKEVELGHDTEYRYNPELEEGKIKVIEEGSNGSVKYTTTFNKETGKLEVTEERVEPTNKVVEYGSKTDGEFTYVSEEAYNIIIRENPNLEAGKTNVIQEGIVGKTETTVKIENSKEVSRNTKTITEKQDKIVEIGTKNVCEIPPVKPTEGETTKTIEREIPYETKVIYDENLEAGSQVIEKEGKLGKEEVTITQKVKDSKPVGDATETTKTITEKEDRVVRVGVKPVVKEVELGHDTEYRHNPELKEGETKVIEEGSKGSVKYTTKFNKETGKLEVTEERVEPTNKVVEYGSKTDGEFTYESEKAYDIKVIEDPDLEAGKVVVDQEGVVGKTKTTVKIVNSQKVSEETETLVEKQDKIVRVGTKNVCEIPPVDPENPGEEDPKDPENPEGEDPKDPENPGEEDPKDPENPGEEDPKDPENPGEEDPKDPENPGEENPKDPENPEGEDPKDPDPGKPEDPKDPDPGKPEDPKDPDSGKPEDPKDPEPNKPVKPSEPGNPEKPEDPKDPDPGKPEDPKDPDPGKPEDPKDPEPNKPGKPNEPGNPEKPEDPKPEKPESPDKTETPDKSEKPKNKDQGVRIDFVPKKSEKAKEAQKDNKSNRAPKTGVSGTSGVLLTLLGATSALFASKKKKKK